MHATWHTISVQPTNKYRTYYLVSMTTIANRLTLRKERMFKTFTYNFGHPLDFFGLLVSKLYVLSVETTNFLCTTKKVFVLSTCLLIVSVCVCFLLMSNPIKLMKKEKKRKLKNRF